MAAPRTTAIERRVRVLSHAGIWGERILGSSAGMVEWADISKENGKTRPPEQVRKAWVGIFYQTTERVVAGERIRSKMG